ncbi:MAG: DinB family protein [Flammeovirgaceae bacterium]
MSQPIWFDRKFDFSFTQNIFPLIIERLRIAPVRLDEKVKSLPHEQLHAKPNGVWSIKENIGHLHDLEPLWIGRLEDILSGQTFLRATDLTNTKTTQANHNTKKLSDLLQVFEQARAATVTRLELLSEKETYLTALHPRLQTPMRTMDLFLFVAEHDDHHISSISKLIQPAK